MTWRLLGAACKISLITDQTRTPALGVPRVQPLGKFPLRFICHPDLTNSSELFFPVFQPTFIDICFVPNISGLGNSKTDKTAPLCMLHRRLFKLPRFIYAICCCNMVPGNLVGVMPFFSSVAHWEKASFCLCFRQLLC